MSWYRTYRSQLVADLDITPVREQFQTLLSSGEYAHAYLLAGPKGTGKTSAARILAKVLNCEKNRPAIEASLLPRTSTTKKKTSSLQEPCTVCASCVAITNGSSLSVTEMDAASNRGIDDIRLLRERIGLSPPDGAVAVFIIDEVHMLTTEAFNALLKVLEEPPAHVVFILATTDVSKMPATVVSRCTLIQYRKATPAELSNRLEKIAKSEGIAIEPASLTLIATAADGSFRDGVKLFEQLASGKKKLELSQVSDALGAHSTRFAADILTALLKKETAPVVEIFSKLETQGIDGVAFQREVLTMAHSKLVEFARSSDKRMNVLVDLMKHIAVPIETSLPLPWMPFEIACVEYTLPAPIKDSQTPPPTSEPAPTPHSQAPAHSKNTESKKAHVPSPTHETHVPVMPIEPFVAPTIEVPIKPITPTPPQATSPQTDATDAAIIVPFEKVQEQWPMVLAKVRMKSIPMEGLLRAIKLSGIEGKSIALEATYQFHKEQMELSRNMLLLETIFQEVFGTPMRYSVKLGRAAVKIIGSPHGNVSGNTDDEKLVKAAEEAFL